MKPDCPWPSCPNKDDAEKWKRATDGRGYKEFTKYRIVYERLKKLIEEMDSHGDVAKIWVREVLLKKVLGEEK